MADQMRKCESCGKPMPSRLHRETRADGKKVCGECMSKAPQPAWAATGLRTEAHESSDDLEIMHCPWCGSGQVTASSDGSIICGYQGCARTFTVRLMPNYPAMPQSIDGQPYPPGQPGADPGMPGDEVPGEMPPEGMDGPPADLSEDEQDPGAPADDDDDTPAFLKGSTFRTATGAELPLDAYMRHLAVIEGGYSDAVLAQVREAAKVTVEDIPAEGMFDDPKSRVVCSEHGVVADNVEDWGDAMGERVRHQKLHEND